MTKRLGTPIAALLSSLAMPALLTAQDPPGEATLATPSGTWVLLAVPNSFVGFTPTNLLNNQGDGCGRGGYTHSRSLRPLLLLGLFRRSRVPMAATAS